MEELRALIHLTGEIIKALADHPLLLGMILQPQKGQRPKPGRCPFVGTAPSTDQQGGKRGQRPSRGAVPFCPDIFLALRAGLAANFAEVILLPE